MFKITLQSFLIFLWGWRTVSGAERLSKASSLHVWITERHPSFFSAQPEKGKWTHSCLLFSTVYTCIQYGFESQLVSQTPMSSNLGAPERR